MKLLRFQYRDISSYGVLQDDTVIAVSGSPFGKIKFSKEYPLSEVKLITPVVPSKIVAVGLNYIDHARELKMEIPEEPIIFLKPATSVLGPGGEIVYPLMSQQIDYEAELAVVIRKKTHLISENDIDEFILGYTCANDVTARDLQRKDGQWTRAKSFDTFSPIGPYIETDVDPSDLKIELLLNGAVRQSSTTANMIFDCKRLVSFISQIMTLLPGDVIMTGTPPGVGSMNIGDKVEVRIERIGSLVNTVVEGG